MGAVILAAMILDLGIAAGLLPASCLPQHLYVLVHRTAAPTREVSCRSGDIRRDFATSFEKGGRGRISENINSPTSPFVKGGAMVLDL